MANTQAMTFKRKLFFFAALTSGSGLAIAAAATLLSEWRELHQRVLSQVSVQTDIIAANLSGALSFDDSKSAVDTLAAFRADPSVLAACVCKPDESLFATYSVAVDAHDSFPCGLSVGHTFANRRLKLVRPIRLHGETIGTVSVDYGLDGLYREMFWESAIAALILSAALAVAQLIAAPVRSALLRPVRDLAQAAHAISDTGNYDTRVAKHADDELGRLADAFNLMVQQVQNRDTELRNARDDLELRVGERTAELAAQKERLGDILRDVDAIVWEADPQTWEFSFVSERAEEILGYPVTQWLNDRDFWVNVIHPEDREQAAARWMQGTDGREDHSFVYRAVAADGRVVWLQDVVRVICGEQGPTVLRGLMIDITERKRNEAFKAGYNRVLELLTEGRDLAEVLQALVNVAEAQVPAMRCSILMLDEEQRLRIAAAPSFPDEYKNAIDGLRIGPAVGSCGTAAYFGERVIVEDTTTDPKWENYRELAYDYGLGACWSEPILASDGRVLGTLAMYYSHARRPEPAEMQLIETAAHLAALAIERTHSEAERSRLVLAVEATADAVIVTGIDGVIQHTNPAFSRITGYPAGELQGARPSILKSGAQTQEFYAQMWQTIRAGQTWSGLLVNRRKDGSLYNAALTISPVCDKQNQITGYVGVQRDVTAEIERERALEAAARLDKLTGLPNRALLHDRVQHAIELAKRLPKYHFAVMFLDLDRFKIVNDSLGHEFGDMLLQAIAARLRKSLRAGDSMSREAEGTTVARLGGDEFVILLDCIKRPEDAATVANRLLKALEAPYQLGEHEVHSTASIGIVCNNAKYDKAEDILRDADIAMYEAKARGPARFVMFDASMQTAVQNRLQIENDLRAAIGTDQFYLVYQPIVSLEDGELHGVEALLRWNHPTRGLISPDEFIFIAEETRLILPLSNWIFEQAVVQFMKWRRQPPDRAPAYISVNLSRIHLAEQDLVEHFVQMVKGAGMEPGQFQLEMTEGGILRDRKASKKVLRALKAAGIRLAMDDFGTGQSSLSCLHELPFDVLKIDRSFVSNLERGQQFIAMARTVVTLAENLGMICVAEGVENRGQIAELKSMGCACAQGYYFGKPMSAEALIGGKWMDAYRSADRETPMFMA